MENPKMKNASAKKPSTVTKVIWLFVLLIIGMMIFRYLDTPKPSRIDTADGFALMTGETVKRITVTDFEQKVELLLTENFKKEKNEDAGLSRDVDNNRVVFYYSEAQAADIWQVYKDKKIELGYDTIIPQTSLLESILTYMLPMILIIGIFYFVMMKMNNGQNSPFALFKSRSNLIGGEGSAPDTTFKNVAGADEADEELVEIRDFMSTPDKFREMGAKIPKGVLLYGPPGTGKTLLARAVAGEAKVPFFSISGSDFVETFVGVGASRVRDLFKRAKEVSPSIIYIDEIDAVGRHRGSGIGGGNDEREQTLNQMLVEMDGFDNDTNVLLIASTNRPDILDHALLRPGRFDRQISVDAPDLKGREAILRIHADGKPFTSDVDLAMVAKRTPGYTGADLANVLNEATLLAARMGKKEVSNDELDEAIDRVMAGPQRRSRKMNDKDLRNTAYHEAGHALVAAAMHYTDPVTKVTILPRGKALGYTAVMPSEDKYSITRNELLDQMAYAMGGRVAEEIVFVDPSTGASNDIQKATDIARNMVTLYGMSAKIGPIKIGADENDTAIGGSRATKYSASGKDGDLVASEMRDLLQNAHKEATIVINENREVLDNLANTLLEKETLLEDELKRIFDPVKRWGERPHWTSLESV